MTQPLRAAIIGTGSVATLHARSLDRIDGVELVAVADVMPGRARAFADEHAAAAHAYDSLEHLFAAETVDVVHLCTPPGVHAPQAVAAFAHGAHVIAEKPPALSLSELQQMTDAAAAADRRFAVVFQQRTGSAADRVKRLLDSGAFGRALFATCNTLWYRDAEYYSVPWRGRWETEGGGTTLSHGIHQIDLLAYLLGDWRAASAQLWRQAREVETEDVSTATILFESGTVASVSTSVVSPRETSSIRIDTERATIEVDHLYGHAPKNWRITPASFVGEEEAAAWNFDDAAFEGGIVPSGHDALLGSVYASLFAGEPLPAVAAEPARALEIVTAFYASAREGGGRVERERVQGEAALRGTLEAPVVDNRGVDNRGVETRAVDNRAVGG
ncbi:Gfo/Idh/MocA family oxidoreductase [Conyzicola nivalis]|uniref:Oxidoreductase n=1 Tax=Conyzicola nivalis TaxID=1477021 RepID=A0A916WJM9_9MICO|nr:Gfo/Idh/MocA family oxidoreductase [Conyzicola nivalis]GGB07710.1 oxidoreductase [Conyzicola nivalis]